jgi:hypothetical protein
VRQILDETASPPHIQRLQPIANAQDWFRKSKRILQKKIIRGLAAYIFCRGGWCRLLPVPRRVYIGWAARQQDP